MILVFCRVTCVSCEEQRAKRDPGELLFAPERLLPSGGSLTVTVTIWRGNSHLRPWSNRRYRRSLHLPGCYWLILLAGDVERNPGPVKFPCTVCSKPVKSNQCGILCSRCEKWTHANCCGVSPVEYQRLGEHEEDPWYCPYCMMSELPFLDTTLSSENGDNDSGDGDRSEVVDRESQMGFDEPFLGRNSSLFVSHLNIRSLVSEHDDLQVFLEKRNVAHVIGLSESWLDSSVSDGEMQVSGFSLHRKDRNRRGGGVSLMMLNV